AQARRLPELRAAGRAVRVGRSMYAHVDAVEQVRERVREIILADGSITLARLRDELGTSRRYAQALLEHFDAARLTLRVGDARVLRSRAGARGPRGGGVACPGAPVLAGHPGLDLHGVVPRTLHHPQQVGHRRDL